MQEYTDKLTVQGMNSTPRAYALSLDEYKLIMQADFIVDRITKRYIAVDDSGQSSVLVTSTTVREIYTAFKKARVSVEDIKALVTDVLYNRKWYALLFTLDGEGRAESGYTVLTSDNDRKQIAVELAAGESSILGLNKEVGISLEYRYIPGDCWEALKQLAIIFEREQTEQSYILPSNFRTIRQGTATNTLTKISTIRNKSIIVDDITGQAVIERGGLTVNIADYVSKGIKIKASTHRLLDALTARFTESGAKSSTVQMPLKEYMELCGLKDEKEARKQVKEDLEALYALTLSFKGKGKNALDFVDFRLCDYKGITNGVIIFNYSLPFYGVLKQYPIMRLPTEYFKLNAKRNPNSAYFLRKISEHKNMNSTKPNENIISVQTLLNSTDELPKYEDIASTGQIEQRIIKPFERDLDALSEVLKWEYCHSNGDPLTDSELYNMDYALFSTLLIKVEWRDYPEIVAQKALERKANANAKKAPRKRGRPKKIET